MNYFFGGGRGRGGFRGRDRGSGRGSSSNYIDHEPLGMNIKYDNATNNHIQLSSFQQSQSRSYSNSNLNINPINAIFNNNNNNNNNNNSNNNNVDPTFSENDVIVTGLSLHTPSHDSTDTYSNSHHSDFVVVSL